jgi:excisionase family DNA binding protein
VDQEERSVTEPLEREKRDRRRREDDLWDAIDVARFLKTSRSWVYMRVERAEIPHVRIGGLIRFESARIRE